MFLGNLGIDIKLLIAQIFNFGILLLLLKKFLYRPVLERIEKDESELEETRVQKKVLDKQMEEFEKQKNRELASAKEQAREIIREAEMISEQVKTRAYEVSEQSKKLVIKQAAEQIKSYQRAEMDKIVEDVQMRVRGSFKIAFAKVLSRDMKEEIQDLFWKELIKKIDDIRADNTRMSNVANILGRLENKGISEESLRKAFSREVGPIILECALPLDMSRKHEIEKLVSEKVGLKPYIDMKSNKDLISGFRFEMLGSVIESNLSFIIDNAANFSKQRQQQ